MAQKVSAKSKENGGLRVDPNKETADEGLETPSKIWNQGGPIFLGGPIFWEVYWPGFQKFSHLPNNPPPPFDKRKQEMDQTW